jgi:Protein of unknown function (DUF1236)
MNNPCKALLWSALALCGPFLATTVADKSPWKLRDDHVAQAQTPSDEPIISSPRTINLTEENRYIIREIILKDPNVRKQAGAQAVIGEAQPQGVTAQPFPNEVLQKIPALRPYEFFVSDGEVIVVDPKSNKVADIVKQSQ